MIDGGSRALANELQKIHNCEETHLPTIEGITEVEGIQAHLYISKVLIHNNGFQNELGFLNTNGPSGRMEFLKNIAKKTEDDQMPRAVIMTQGYEYDNQKKYSYNHTTFFGTRIKNGVISCSGMDSNALVNHGEGREGLVPDCN